MELAATYLARLDQGEEPDLEIVANTLPEEVLRDQFRRLIGDARSVQDLLPVQVHPGTLLSGRYRVGVQIGSGGMGKVYEAFDRQLERTVALKVLSLPSATSFDAKNQFRREAVMLAGLHHPNIVAVHEVATEGDVNYIVMDLVRGMPLDEVIERVKQLVESAATTAARRTGLLREVLGPSDRPGAADEPSWHRAAARVVREAAYTVEAAHAAGLVHRDIKPKNVILRADGSPVLLDFGLAGACDPGPGEDSRGLFGTTSYLAPEQVQSGDVGSDPRSDVYQLGVLLHEILTLGKAFEGGGAVELMQRISGGDFRRPREVDPSVPFELEAICLRAMELEPSSRYQSARALREDLDRYLAGVDVPIAVRGSVGRLLRGSRYALRRHRLVAAAAGALLLGASLGMLFWISGEEAPASKPVPEISPFRYNTVTQLTDIGGDILSVSPGDELGVMIDTPVPVYVYVMSFSGSANSPRSVAPMSLKWNPFLAAASDGQGPAFHPFGGTIESCLYLQPGRTQVRCTVIEHYDPSNPYEGLWVFTSREPAESLERWFDTVDAEARVAERKMVDYATARRLFADSGPTTRGRPPGPATPQQSRAMADGLTAAMLLGESEWPFEDPRRWSVGWPVQP
jgi:serine/threonine protein kinase